MFFKALEIFLLLLLRQSLISSTQSILISKGKPAAQSFTFTTFVAGLAVDGNTVSTCSLTAAGNTPQWWYVDLEDFYDVDYVYLHTSIAVDGVEVHVSNDVSSTRDSSNKCGSVSSTSTINIYLTHCNPTINGRYVFVSRSDNMSLLLCEVEVYAVPSSPCDSSPCLNGGVCNDFTTSYTCSCPPSYTGLNCQTFEDTIEPVVLCPADMNVSTESSEIFVTWDDPVVTDNIPGLSAVCYPSSGSTFSLGSTNVTCFATDGSNIGYCIFKVHVIEAGDPIVMCPSYINMDTDTSNATVTWDDPSVSDNIDTGLSAVCSPSSGSLFPVGFTVVTCTATDNAGNDGSCTFTVRVNDVGKPIVVCPDVLKNTATCETTVTWDDPTVTDNVDTGLSAVCSPSSGSLFPVCSTSVTCNATDKAGNEGSCTFTGKVSVIEDNRDDTCSIPSYLIVVLVIVCVALLVTFPAFIFYCRSYYSLKNRMQNSTGMNLTDYDEVNVKTTTNIQATEYEVNLPNVDGTAPPKLELNEGLNSGYEDLHTYIPVEAVYTDIKQ